MALKLQHHNGIAKYQAIRISGYSRKYPHTLIDGIEFGTKNIRISKEEMAVFVAFKPFIDSKSWGIQEFRKTLNGFSQIPDQNSQNSWEIYGLPVSLTESSLHDFQCCLGGRGRIFSGIRVAHHRSSFEGNLMNFYSQSKISELW